MTDQDLRRLHEWFRSYCSAFSAPDPADQRNFTLKQEHTLRVCENSRRIARDEGLPAPEQALAEAIALFHDVGRFPQYQQYRTFKDSDSINHAALGAAVLLREQTLAALPAEERRLIVRTVALHNVFSIPPGLDDELLRQVRLIRDADKLDVWQVFLDYYSIPQQERPSAVALGLPDLPVWSPQALETLRSGRMVRLDMLTTLTDFKLLQLSWIFDLNYPASFSMVSERQYIRRMAETLPAHREIASLVHDLERYVEQRMRKGQD